MPHFLDPVVVRTMPPRVAAFMLYEPPDPTTVESGDGRPE
jgi:hypothetical protein